MWDKEKNREYMREYCQRPEAKVKKREYMREYHQRPEVKEKKREYMREYYQRPEAKEKKREYMREYYQRPEVKEKEREYQRDISSDKKFWQMMHLTSNLASECKRAKKSEYNRTYRIRRKELANAEA